MFPWIAAIAGLLTLRCPHCKQVQQQSRRLERIRCNACGREFAKTEGVAAAKRTQRPL